MFAFFVYKFEVPLSKLFSFLVVKLGRQTTAAAIGYQPVPATFLYNPDLPAVPTYTDTPPSFPTFPGDAEQTPFSEVPEFVPFQPVTQPSIMPPPFWPNEGKQISSSLFVSS